MSALSDIAFRAVLERVEAGTTTADDARWLRMYVRELQAEADHPEGVVLLHQGGQVTGAVQLFRHGGDDGDQTWPARTDS